MRWVKLDVDYWRNPKARAAGRTGRALHLASIAYSGSQLTDGVVARSSLSQVLQDAEVPRSAVERVVSAGLWLPVGDDFIIHDFVEMNGSREEVLARIEAERKRKERWRASKAARNGSAT